MRRLTKRQKEEVDFLSKEFKVSPTNQEIEEFIAVSVHGKGSGKVQGAAAGATNCLLQAKRLLEITVPLWKEDLVKGRLSAGELTEGFSDYGKRLVRSLVESVTPEYRRDALREPNTGGVLAVTNFPGVLEDFKGK